MISQELKCPNCQSLKIVKRGQTQLQKQRFLCKDCKRTFIERGKEEERLLIVFPDKEVIDKYKKRAEALGYKTVQDRIIDLINFDMKTIEEVCMYLKDRGEKNEYVS
jgi:transposase-like protein